MIKTVFDAWIDPPRSWAYLTSGARGVLGVYVNTTRAGFLTVAIEYPGSVEDAAGKSEEETVALVLEDHAHVVLGTRKTLRGAKALAERYVAKWKAWKRADPCGCGEIAEVAA